MACACGVAGGFLGLTFREWLASVISLRLWKETVMDTTVRGIDAVVVAELRAAGYMESTVGQYAKTIKALTEFASGREYSTSVPEGSDFVALDAAWQAEMGRRGLGQVERAVPRFPSYRLDPRTVEHDAALYPDASAWLTENLGATPVLMYSAAAASERGPADPAAAADLERMMGALAALAVAAGAHRIMVAGGETSGAIVDTLGIKAVVVNAEMDTGVPWCSTVDDDPVTLLLKSGNFGKQDLPVRAATVTEL
jgi:hypothetical protein